MHSAERPLGVDPFSPGLEPTRDYRGVQGSQVVPGARHIRLKLLLYFQ